MYKEDLALDKQQWLLCHEKQPNQILYIKYICIKRIWLWITNDGWYAKKLNQTKPNPIDLIYIHKQDLVLNNLQWLICHD